MHQEERARRSRSALGDNHQSATLTPAKGLRGLADARAEPQARLGQSSSPPIAPLTPDSPTGIERTTPPPTRQLRRQLQPAEVDELVAAYLAGDAVNDLAQQFGVHRTTVMAHLARREAKRPTTSAKWDDDTLAAAARLYADGASLNDVGARFGVHASTVANRFHHAGV